MESKLEQFQSRGRYTVIPRTLVFLTNGDAVLLLKGAPTKRLWANKYNGLGGHVESGESIRAAALREVWEEAGIAAGEIEGFELRALLNIAGEPHGVMLCVFTGKARSRAVIGSPEGTPEWIPLDRLAEIDLVDDHGLVRRQLESGGVLFGHQRQADGERVSPLILE